MNNIDSIPGKLFYVVHSMFKENTIDGRGKVILKDLIIMNASQINAAYEEYEASGTELTLKRDLFRILNQEREAEKAEGLSDRSKKSRGHIKVKVPRMIQTIPQYIRPS